MDKLEVVVDAIKDAKAGQNIIVKMVNMEEKKLEIALDVFIELEKRQAEDINLKIELPNGLTWVVDAKTITKDKWSDSLKAIDFFAEIVTGEVPSDAINSVVVENQEALELKLSHNGEFGFSAVLNIPVGEQYAGKNITLYYYNTETGALEEQGTNKVDEAGGIEFTFTHASEYVLVVEAAQVDTPVDTPEDKPADTETNETPDDTQSGEQPSEETPGLPIIPIVIVLVIIAIAGVALVVVLNTGKIKGKNK